MNNLLSLLKKQTQSPLFKHVENISIKIKSQDVFLENKYLKDLKKKKYQVLFDILFILSYWLNLRNLWIIYKKINLSSFFLLLKIYMNNSVYI